MDLQQNKLTRAEWNSIEEPISQSELEVLKLLVAGYKNPTICINKTQSLFNYVKIENTQENEYYLYTKYFAPIIEKYMKKYGETIGIQYSQCIGAPLKKIKSIDQARLQNLDSHIPQTLYEFVLLELAGELLKQMFNKKQKYSRCLYTLIHVGNVKITQVNNYVKDFIDKVMKKALEEVRLSEVVEYAVDFIEQNKFLATYQDRALYDHQQSIYRLFGDKTNLEKRLIPKLVLYSAPTGTGKTLTPIGLAEDYRVIFVCVARHIGLALAKSAISVERKIAFAFGCSTASDIRLHYFAASEYQKDKRSGGIKKVNNECGEKVEIMICDVKSYQVAMLYMLAFNPPERIITYWDEPTITLDYETHELHSIIHKNWSENKIPNMVLSCATLPKESELIPVLSDFRNKFEGAEIHTITSYDYKKSIPLLNKDGYTMVPHRMYNSWMELQRCVRYCEENLTLLRYFDLGLIVDFLFKLHNHKKQVFLDEILRMENYFSEGGIASITMMSLKIYYLRVLRSISEEDWPAVYELCNSKRETKFFRKSVKDLEKGNHLLKRTVSLDSSKYFAEPSNGLLITTSDAFTLTDGPTIYLCEDVSKIGNFYLQQSAIPQELMQNVLRIISNNNALSTSITKLEQILEDMDKEKQGDKESGDKHSDIFKKPPEMQKMYKEIEELRKQVKYVSLDPAYIPNTSQHMSKWAPKAPDELTSSFVPTIDEESVREIMALSFQPAENYLKVLLLLGIGLFMEGVHPIYLEVMKRLASRQQLFMIIASTDYTYGTNYSFCHGFIGKDLARMTKQKTLQCMGRIGRSGIQQTYTIRFRDDDMLYGLFKEQERNLEAENMCALFCSE